MQTLLNDPIFKKHSHKDSTDRWVEKLNISPIELVTF